MTSRLVAKDLLSVSRETTKRRGRLHDRRYDAFDCSCKRPRPDGLGGLYGSKWQLNVGAPFLTRKGRFCLRHWAMVDGWTGP